jgi:hypothetical protein
MHTGFHHATDHSAGGALVRWRRTRFPREVRERRLQRRLRDRADAVELIATASCRVPTRLAVQSSQNLVNSRTLEIGDDLNDRALTVRAAEPRHDLPQPDCTATTSA